MGFEPRAELGGFRAELVTIALALGGARLGFVALRLHLAQSVARVSGFGLGCLARRFGLHESLAQRSDVGARAERRCGHFTRARAERLLVLFDERGHELVVLIGQEAEVVLGGQPGVAQLLLQ
jgi:hypothetical protein